MKSALYITRCVLSGLLATISGTWKACELLPHTDKILLILRARGVIGKSLQKLESKIEKGRRMRPTLSSFILKMPNRVAFQVVKVAISGQSDGRLVFIDGDLVAVVTRLDQTNEDFAGRWFAEVHFEGFEEIQDRTFGSLEEVEAYIESNYRRH